MALELYSQLTHCRIIECSHKIQENSPVWPDDRSFLRCPFRSYETDGSFCEKYELPGGFSTHIDSPAHFIPNGRDISSLTGKELISYGVCIDVRDKIQHTSNPNYELSVEDILEWENIHGNIPKGALVCMRTGWGAKFNDIGSYLNHDPSEEHPFYPGGVMRFPGFSAESASFLCTQRDINGIGIDTLSLDPGSSTNYQVHSTMFSHDKYQIENMYLEELPESGFVIISLPLRMQGAPEMCARILALIP